MKDGEERLVRIVSIFTQQARLEPGDRSQCAERKAGM